MKQNRRTLLFIGLIHVCIFCFLSSPGFTYSRALLYKSYAVLKDQGQNILCDAYTVRKNDYVLKLLKERGEISQSDFPEFLKIFQRINPHIPNINQIRIGQDIYIPLKKLSSDMLPGQASGVVTLPFVTVSKTYDIIKSYSRTYRIKKGDYVSRLISKEFGSFNSQKYREGIKLFKRINPEVTNINKIYRKQIVHILQRSITDQPWYSDLFDPAGNVVNRLKHEKFESVTPAGTLTAQSKKSPAASPTAPINQPETPYHLAAAILNARLNQTGTTYFPRQGRQDFKLDLSRFPVMNFKNGRRLLFIESDDTNDTELDLNSVKSFWKNVSAIEIVRNPSVVQLVDAIFQSLDVDVANRSKLTIIDHGINIGVSARWIIHKPMPDTNISSRVCITLIKHPDERTSASLCRYLQQHRIVIQDKLLSTKLNNGMPESRNQRSSNAGITIASSHRESIVSQIATVLGFTYDANVTITFPYVGIQISTTSNLITHNDGRRLLIDYGNLYGDAITSIQQNGIRIIQIIPGDTLQSIIKKLLSAMDMQFTEQPTFYGAKRAPRYNTAVTVPGFLISNSKKRKMLLTPGAANKYLHQFLNEQQIDVIQIHYTEHNGF